MAATKSMSYHFRFSERTNWSLATNPLLSALGRLKENNVQVFDLTESNPTACGFSYLNERITAVLSREENNTYAPHPAGLLSARQAISDYYQRKSYDVPPERLFLTSSTSEAYSVILRLLLNPGEKVLVPAPSYPLFEYLIELNDNEVSQYPLVYDGQWKVDVETLSQKINAKTRVMILVNPNNPTGSFVDKKDLAEINRLAHKYNLSIICDEVFLDYGFDPKQKPLSLVANEPALTFVLGGISKSLGLPQMKLAWVALGGPQKLIQSASERLEVILDTYLSVNTPSQNALSGWFQSQPAIQAEILQRLNGNRKFIEENILAGSRCRFLNAQGGWYAVLKLPGFKSEEEWALKFLREDHVFVHPGYFFDLPEGPYIVVSLLPKPEIFAEGLSRILEKVEDEGG